MRTIFRRSAATLLLVVLSALGMLGCGNPRNRPITVPAGGQVFFRGEPVAGAEVVFLPMTATERRAARGTSGADGRFSLRTFFSAHDDAAGASTGEYAVTIRKIPPPPARVDPLKPATIPHDALPDRYGDPRASGLSATVPEGGKNDFEFRLTP